MNVTFVRGEHDKLKPLDSFEENSVEILFLFIFSYNGLECAGNGFCNCGKCAILINYSLYSNNCFRFDKKVNASVSLSSAEGLVNAQF